MWYLQHVQVKDGDLRWEEKEEDGPVTGCARLGDPDLMGLSESKGSTVKNIVPVDIQGEKSQWDTCCGRCTSDGGQLGGDSLDPPRQGLGPAS